QWHLPVWNRCSSRSARPLHLEQPRPRRRPKRTLRSSWLSLLVTASRSSCRSTEVSAESPMAFDQNLAARIRKTLPCKRGIEEKGMFGCICFFVNGNALAGVWKDRLIARLGSDEAEVVMREPHVRAFDITGRPMRNWVAVESEGVEDDE